jgi:hypothetical protein
LINVRIPQNPDATQNREVRNIMIEQEQSYEDFEQKILDTCDFFIISQELGQDVAMNLLEKEIVDSK